MTMHTRGRQTRQPAAWRYQKYILALLLIVPPIHKQLHGHTVGTTSPQCQSESAEPPPQKVPPASSCARTYKLATKALRQGSGPLVPGKGELGHLQHACKAAEYLPHRAVFSLLLLRLRLVVKMLLCLLRWRRFDQYKLVHDSSIVTGHHLMSHVGGVGLHPHVAVPQLHRAEDGGAPQPQVGGEPGPGVACIGDI